MARVAFDMYGSDERPGPEQRAVVQLAARLHELPAGVSLELVLVGDEAVLGPFAATLPPAIASRVRVVHAPDTIAMDASAAKAIREQPDASMPRCFELLKAGEVDAVVSAGHSGVMLAAGLFKVGRIKGVDRPAIMTSLPSVSGTFELLDAGANTECKPLNLVQWAVLGAARVRLETGRAPRVAVLSNGEEDSKGTALTRATAELLRAHPSDAFTFVGYVEGNHIFDGEVDVVVTDGFTGNVTLKAAEGAAKVISAVMKQEVLAAGLVAKLGGLAIKPALAKLKRRTSADGYGGAPLVGVRGVVLIAHGSSSETALASAVLRAAAGAGRDELPALEAALAAHAPLIDAAREIKL